MLEKIALISVAGFVIACGVAILAVQLALCAGVWMVVVPIGFGVECRDRLNRWRVS